MNFDITSDWFRVIFNGRPPQKTPQKYLTELERKILNEIVNDASISRNRIATNLNLNPYTVKEYLNKLKRKKVIRRVGPDNGGYWEILE